MTKMNAAVVTSFAAAAALPAVRGAAPSDGEVARRCPRRRPAPARSQRRRGQHYTSSGTLPMIPGIDGVGRLPDGRLVYFAADDDVLGTMADKAVVDPRRAVELPAGADVAKGRRRDESGDVLVGRAAPPGPAQAGAERPCPRRDRQRRRDGGAGRQAARRRAASSAPAATRGGSPPLVRRAPTRSSG